MAKTREPRSKWHEDHRLAEVRETLRRKARNRIDGVAGLSDSEANRITRVSLHVFRDCDLRATLEEKSASCNKFSAWTAFVNKAGTLIHVVPKDGDMHIRIPIFYSVANRSTSHIERIIGSYLTGRLK